MNAIELHKVSVSNGEKQLVVCHDAGAANIIMSNEEQAGFSAHRYCLQGPALAKWGSKVPAAKLCNKLTDAISDAGHVLTGTGWASDLEHDARRIAKERGIRTSALIDHWVNYEKRFIRNAHMVLPDEILVSDSYAQSIAETTFPSTPINIAPNAYLEQAVARVSNMHPNTPNDILYVLEPVPEDWQGPVGKAEEFQALDYFARFIKYKFRHPYNKIRMRLHPSEAKDKYAAWVKCNQALPIVFDEYQDIEQSIANANWVFGCESYGLIVALSCGKSVYSTIPEWAPLARLPHKGIKQVRDYMRPRLIA
ncbi:hypothetical protein PN836_008950 [Ningiella sp. W23]|uniref:hypothetical protein n=1 Tax=Ningiella sp. W23 TaxID=3023715 RepID=UPI003756C3A6